MAKRGPAKSKQTLEIIKKLKAEAARMAEGGSRDWGFRTRLAQKYGLSRARISAIAQSLGLTDHQLYHAGKSRGTGSTGQGQTQ